MHTKEPWYLKDFVGTHQICASSVDPDSEPVALLCMADYSRSIACVNALAGVPDPAAFMAAVDAVLENFESGYGFGSANKLADAVFALRSARGKTLTPKGR